MSRLVLATAIVAVCCSFTLEARAQAPVSVRTVTAPLSVSTSGLDQESSTEVELSETVNLEGVFVVFLDTIVAEISRSGDGCTTVRGRITLLAGGDEVLSGPFGVIVWCSADRPGILTIRLGIGLDSTAVVDRLRVDIWNVGSGTATSSFSGLFHENVGNDLLQLHFVRAPSRLVAPGEGGENRVRFVSGVQPKSLAGAELVSPWSGYVFDQPVPAQQLRYMHHAGFGCRSRGTSGRISTESQLVLDDGSFLSLDDWRSPSNGEAPPVNTTSTCSNSLLLDTETRLALRDRTVVGWRWRIHKSGNEGEVTFTPPEAVFFAFFYDCDLSSNPPELAQDCNANGIADGCEADCNGNGVPDDCDIAEGTSTDCDQNSLPDECDILPENIDLAPSAGIRDRPVRARAVLALDLDGDDVPDLVTAGLTSTVSTFPGAGDGSFGDPSSVRVGFSAHILVASDLDQDGAPDLIATRPGGLIANRRVALLRNDGNGAFADPVTIEVAERPTTLIATDLNGDGAPDLVTGHRDLPTLSVLLNDGGLVFSAAAGPKLEEPAVSLAVLDLDGDGDRDLVAAGEQRLTLLTNDGVGTLSVERAIELPFAPQVVRAADLDGDGRLDLVLGQADAFLAHVMLGEMGGGFAAPVGYGFHASSLDTRDVQTADVDGDGALDLVMISSRLRMATVLRGEGDGSFGVPQNFPLGDPADTTTGAEALATADFDADGSLDVVVALRTRDVFLLRNSSLPPSAIDCNANGSLDSCELDSDPGADGDENGILDECEGVQFARADANNDGNVDLSDPVAILGFLFLGSSPPSCLSTADADDNGAIELTDPIRILNFLFLGGPMPAEPFGKCDTDPTPDDLTCESFDGCP